MFLDTFLHARVKGLSLRGLASGYAEWLLGIGASPRARATRLQEGVKPDWNAERVLAAESLVGDHGCRVDMRVTEGAMIVRFVHRDTREGAIIWNTVARASLTGDGTVLVEHAVGRDAPKGQFLHPIAAAPRIITSLLDRDGVEVAPRELNVALVTLRDGDAPRYVEHELLRPDREVPILAVSCGRGDAPPLLDVARLSTRLRGLVSIVHLATTKSTFEFGDALLEHGFGREFRCFDSGAHLYGPTNDLRNDHRLWLGDSLADVPPTDRDAHLAGLIARRIALRQVPPNFFTIVEEHDREEKRRLTERLLQKPSTPPPPSSATIPIEYVRTLEGEREVLREQLLATVSREKEYAEHWMQADEERRDAERDRDDAEARLEQERAISAELRDQLARAKEEKRPRLDSETVQALDALLAGNATPHDHLVVLRATYPERVTILDSAFTSAKKSFGFRHTPKLAVLLRKLATTYYDALVDGKGDNDAAATFGEAFAAKESSVTMQNDRARKERTFRYRDKEVVMWPHLKIGIKDSVAETIRVHFEWLAETREIVIGWCGEHRYKV